MSGFELQVHGGARKQPLRHFDRRSTGGDIDDDDDMARPDSRRNDPVLADARAARVATIDESGRHRAFH
jgi:hypothetical protein